MVLDRSLFMSKTIIENNLEEEADGAQYREWSGVQDRDLTWL
jgi:hypothetical protein